MAAHFTTRVYGFIEGSPPYTNAAGQSAFSRAVDYSPAPLASLPTDGTVFFALPNGYQMASGKYVYSVIQVPASGLQTHGVQYVTDSSVTTLATAVG